MSRIFVGNLPIDIREREIDDLFYKYGRIREIDLKVPSRPPAFAFISFEDPRDAEDAIRGRDGYNFDGLRLRVEMTRGTRGGRDDHRDRDRDRDGNRDRDFHDRDRDRDRGYDRPRKTGGGKRTDYGITVTGLPKGCSWQDLKDYMRKAGDVVYANVEYNGEGIVDFSNREDMERAIEKFDDEKFEIASGSSYIRVRANKPSGGNGNNDRARSPNSKDRDSHNKGGNGRDYDSEEEYRGRKRGDSDDVKPHAPVNDEDDGPSHHDA